MALVLGLLVGLQREWTAAGLAGIRTFPLITLFGAISAAAAEEMGGWIVAVGLLSLTAVFVAGNVIFARKLSKWELDPGATTEVAGLVMFGVGVLLVMDHRAAASAVAGAVVVLLHMKEPLHAWVAKIGEKDIKAVVQFALVSLVILPLLPNETFGWYDVFNPYKTWMLVVLIVGISLTAYLLFRFVGAKAGVLLGGLLGGMISSTATTVSYARRSVESPESAKLSAVVVMIASAVVNVRVLIEIAAVAPGFLAYTVGPFAALTAVMAVISGVFFWGVESEPLPPPKGNPAQLKEALAFAAVYVVVMFAVAAVKENFGNQGLYVVAVVSGLTDMDAITLSTADLFQSGSTPGEVAWRVVMTATMANLCFKGFMAFSLGSRSLSKRVAVGFGVAFAAGLAMIFLWPFPPIAALAAEQAQAAGN